MIIGNPYLTRFEALCARHTTDMLTLMRPHLLKEYAFAIPNEPALRAILDASPHGVVEIGAGNGYWAGLLAARGGDVIAYDIGGWDRFMLVPPTLLRTGTVIHNRYHPVMYGSTPAVREHGTRTLLICAPPRNNPLAVDAAQTYHDVGGRCIVYVGEQRGGCTASDDFYTFLAAHYRETATVEIPQWPRMDDYLSVHHRR